MPKLRSHTQLPSYNPRSSIHHSSAATLQYLTVTLNSARRSKNQIMQESPESSTIRFRVLTQSSVAMAYQPEGMRRSGFFDPAIIVGAPNSGAFLMKSLILHAKGRSQFHFPFDRVSWNFRCARMDRQCVSAETGARKRSIRTSQRSGLNAPISEPI